jgi:hypothetical protein
MTTRARVIEWRITRKLGDYEVRFWVESDPEFGGVSWALAHVQVDDVIALLEGGATLYPQALAEELLEQVPAANSVEVCVEGQGVAVHRDWP